MKDTAWRMMLLFATIPLYISIVLFLCWYIPRSFYARDYFLLERAGLYCYLFFLAGLVIAFLLLLVWCVQNKAFFHPRTLLAIAVLGISYFLGQKLLAFGLAQKEQAFVRIENRSGQDLTCNLHPYFGDRIKQFIVKDSKHKMFIYKPRYDVMDDKRDLKLKDAYLEIRKGEQHVKINFPPIDAGACKRLVLDQHLKLRECE